MFVTWRQRNCGFRSKTISLTKEKGVDNTADLGTKRLDLQTLQKHVEALDFYIKAGRSASALSTTHA